MDNTNKEVKSVLSDSVRVFFNGLNEIRIRKGIWNYEEAILSLDGIGENFKNAFIKLLNKLEDKEAIDFEVFLDEEQLSPEDKTQIKQVLEALTGQNYIHPEKDAVAKHLLYDLIGGTVAGKFYKDGSNYRPILFFADTQSVIDYAIMLAKEINLPMTVLSESQFKDISLMDLTSKLDGLDTRKQMEELKNFIEPFSCIVGCMERPHVNFLRNLNRVLIKTSKVLSMALLDGPFTSVFTIKPPETGCFECYENRLFARMQEMPVYKEFVEHTRKSANPMRQKTFASPIMHSIVSTALFEGFLVSTIGKAKFAGRVLNTYLPIMEIQVQDLLRVPFCPACGFISEARMDEMYTSTKKMIDKVIDNVVIKNAVTSSMKG
jgi:thiazole/oxazole-forming peptide maturase SagC family component